MEKYVGFKITEAEPMTWGEFVKQAKLDPEGKIPEHEGLAEEGYLIGSDTEFVWQDKASFEEQHLFKLDEHNKITKELVEASVDKWQHTIMEVDGQNKTVIVMAILKNGFVIVESSSCVDPANFDFNIGFNSCVNRIYNKIWELTGFVLQCVQPLLKTPDNEIVPLPESVEDGDVENASV